MWPRSTHLKLETDDDIEAAELNGHGTENQHTAHTLLPAQHASSSSSTKHRATFEVEDTCLNASTPHKDGGMESSTSTARHHITAMSEFKEVIAGSKLNILLLCCPLALVSRLLRWGDGWSFAFALIALCPLAERLGFVTEQLAAYTNATLGGLLNATFGNATELIVAIFALRNGLLRVVQLTLLGSVLSNMLLVLGTAFIVGGARYKVQHFSSQGMMANSGLLLLGVLALILPNVLSATHTELQPSSSLMLSRISALLLLLMYAAFLYFQMASHRDLYEDDDVRDPNDDGDDGDDDEPVVLRFWTGIAWLAAITLVISLLSDAIVDAIEGAATAWNVPMAFVSTIVLPIVGNAAEHAAAIMFAAKNKMAVALGVAIGSSTQIAVLVIPLCVTLAWMMRQPLDLNFHLFETAALFSTVVIVVIMLNDGKSHWLKGLTLVLAYAILAASFFFHCDGSESSCGAAAAAPSP